MVDYIKKKQFYLESEVTIVMSTFEKRKSFNKYRNKIMAFFYSEQFNFTIDDVHWKINIGRQPLITPLTRSIN